MTQSEAPVWHRLHWSSLLFRLFPLVKSFLVPAALVFFLSEGGRWQLWLPLLILPALLVEWYRCRTLRYRLDEEELVVTTGRWFRGERHIPYARIQNIDLTQGVLHRLLDVGEIEIETASGAHAEARLVVLSRQAERQLRDAVARGRQAHAAASDREAALDGMDASMPEEPADTGETLLALRGGEIARIAVDPGRSLIPLGVLMGIGWEFDLFERFHVWNRLEEWFEAGGLGMGWLDGVLLALAAFLLLTLFSWIGTTLMFHGFTLRLVDDQFRIRRGLLTKVRATLPRRRVQLVSVHESWLHRRMGRVRVRVGTAGKGGGGEEGHEQEESWLAPLLPRDQLPQILDAIDPRFRQDEPLWRAFPRAGLARGRRVAWRAGFLAAVALVLIGTLVDEAPAWLVWLAPLPGVVMWWAAGRAYRAKAYALDGARFILREGWWKRRTSYLLMEKVQSADVENGIFDRRWGQATLGVDTAAGKSTGHHFILSRLDRPLADALQAAIVRRADAARFRWS